jgi:hypothetical protein
MARATNHSTTRLSNLFRDPFLRAAFKAAEDDGTSLSRSKCTPAATRTVPW